MRCLQVIPGVAPRYGGPSQMIFQISRALMAAGAEVLIATTDADGSGRLPVMTGVAIDYQGVPTVFFRRSWSEPFKYSPGLAGWLRRHVAEFDLVHIHAVYSHSSLAAAWACRGAGIPYMVRPLGSLDPWSLGRKRWRKRLLAWWGVNRMLREAAAIHYTTEAERRLAELRRRMAPGLVLPLGIEAPGPEPQLLAEFRRQHPRLQDSPYVLALSRLHPKKRLELLLNAFARVTARDEFSDWRLVVAGEGDPAYVQSLQQLVSGMSGSQRILFVGWLSGPTKAAVLAGAQLLALTSRQENFGVAAAEALVSNVPVLLSRHVNLADEVAAAQGGWVADLEERALAGTLHECLASPEERRRRGRLGGEWARRQFGWPRIAGELAGVYRKIASGGGEDWGTG